MAKLAGGATDPKPLKRLWGIGSPKGFETGAVVGVTGLGGQRLVTLAAQAANTGAVAVVIGHRAPAIVGRLVVVAVIDIDKLCQRHASLAQLAPGVLLGDTAPAAFWAPGVPTQKAQEPSDTDARRVQRPLSPT